MPPKSLAPALPLKAAHLRFHKSLDLHLFDANRNFLAAVPLLDQMVTVWLIEDTDGKPFYQVDVDQADETQTLHLHYGLELPVEGSDYFDLEDVPEVLPVFPLKFRFGFHKNPEDQRLGSLAGIGTVHISDISVGPLPTQRSLPIGCNPLGWLFPPKPIPSPNTLIGKPATFPPSNSPLFSLTYDFCMCSDRRVDGAHHLRLGAFLGKVAPNELPMPYLMVIANPLLVTVSASLLEK